MTTFLDFLRAGDLTGRMRAIADEQAADLAAGITWGVYRDGVLIESHPAEYMADCAAWDNADASDRDRSEYEVRPVEEQ